MSGVPSTLDAFKWFFRDTALWACFQHNPAGGIDAVHRVLRELNLLEMPPIGPGVKFRNIYTLHEFPEGMICAQGDPNNIHRYGVWAIKNRRMVAMLGAAGPSSRMFEITEVPGVTEPPEWLNVKASAQQASLLVDWKKEAWAVAYQAKVRHGWCGDFERVMFSMEVRPS